MIKNYELNHPQIIIYYKSKKKLIDIKNYIENNSDILKNKYLDFCKKIENIKLTNRSLYGHFEIANNHNLWEMSLIKEKSNLKSDSIYKVIIFLAIEKIISENKINKIIFSNILIKEKVLDYFFKNKKIIYEHVNTLDGVRTPKLFLKNFFLVRLVFYFIFLLRKIFIELKSNNFIDSNSNFTVFSYFAHFKKITNNLSFSQFGDLNNMLKSKYALDTQYIFVPNKNNKSINSLPSIIKKNYSFLNGNLNFYNKLSIIYKFFFYSFKFFFIKKIIISKLNNVHFCLFSLLSKDYEYSFCGPVLIDNLIWISVFENYLSKTKKKECGIFLLENQAWEKAMITSWKNYKHGEIIGYTPTSINYWHLYNFDCSTKNYTSPSKVLVSSDEGFKLLKNQYRKKNIKIFKVESLWFNYLLKIKNIKNNQKKEFILILGDYLPENNYKIFEIILNSNINKSKAIFFKPHPHDMHKYNIKNITITKKNNEHFFKLPVVVVSPGSTSAVLEYLYFGKKVYIYDDPDGLDLSPVKNLDYQFRFKSVKDFHNILKVNFSKKTIVNNFKNYYFLDKNLKKWKNIFYI